MEYFLLIIPVIIFGCWQSWKNKPRNRAEEFKDMLNEKDSNPSHFEKYRKGGEDE